MALSGSFTDIEPDSTFFLAACKIVIMSVLFSADNTAKGKLGDSLSVFSVRDLNQKESELSKLSDDKLNLESKIHTLEEDISNSKNEIPDITIDIERKLKAISSSKYRIV